MKDHPTLGQRPVYIREKKYMSTPVLVVVSSA